MAHEDRPLNPERVEDVPGVEREGQQVFVQMVFAAIRRPRFS
jgi:hypothetical protein